MTPETASIILVVLCLWAAAWHLSSPKWRQAILLIASYVFYAQWGLDFLLILVASSVLNYFLGALIRRRPTAGTLWIGIAFNLALLGFFKYLPPLVQGLTVEPGGVDFLRQIVMPVGISFWTFQALSYLFDVYREEELQPSLFEFCLYMAFWPTVLSGPVCRLGQMLPQFRKARGFDHDDIVIGTRRLIQGLIMKFALAEVLASGLSSGEGIVAGFDQMRGGWGAVDVWVLAIGFGFQLFFDFAGYSHIVIGIARLFGIRLQENFDRPYFSLTPSVFWTRWHMSLSFWIRDYVFLPLATLRRDPWWLYFVLLLAMTLFGLWHGAKGTFILWGVYHGSLLVMHRLGQRLKVRLSLTRSTPLGAFLSWAVTFALVSLGWIFFRANDLHQALAMLGALFSVQAYGRLSLPLSLYLLVPLVMLGYFAYEALRSTLTRWSEEDSAEGKLSSGGTVALELLQLLRGRVWWWLAPICFVAAGVMAIEIVEQSAPATPFMYTLF